MKCVIRIAGSVGLKKEIIETFKRMNLNRKYSCVIIHENEKNKGMLRKIKDYVAFGDIDEKTLEKIIEKRGKSLDSKKIDFKKVAEEISKGKTMKNAGLIPVFRLHPARGGIKSTLYFPRGVLGDHKKDINKLVEKML